jgi:hypothetical protein
LEKSFFDKLPPNPNRHSPAYNFSDGGKVLASSSSKEGINKLIEQYLYGSTITLVQTDNDKIYEVHNKKGKTSFYVELSRGKYKFIQPSMYDNGGDLEENSNRNETQENNFGVSYKLGDKFTLGKKFGNKDEQVSITEIMPSGLFFKVDKSDKLFSIKTLHSRGSNLTSGEYLVPIKKKFADGGVAETMNFFVVNNENDKNYNRVGYSIDETITDYKQGKEFEKLYFENKKLPKKYNVNDLIYLEQRSHFTQKDKYSDGETSFVILVDYESSPKPYYYLYNVTKKFVATEGGLDWVKSNLPKGWKFYDSYSDGGGINESISETDKLDSEIFNSLLKIYKSEGNSGTDLFSFSESKLQKLLSEGAFNRLKSGKSPLGKIQLYGGSLGKYYAINIANGDFYERLKKYADGGKTDKWINKIVRRKNLRGGYNNYEIMYYDEMYEKYRLKDLEKDLTISATTKEIKNEFEFVDKYEDGGEAAEYQIIDKKTEKYYSRSISDGKIKWNDSPDMGYMFTMKDANQIKESLHQSGYEQLEVVKYDANWWRKAKYEKGGAIYPDLSLQKADVVNDSITLNEFEIKKMKNTFKIDGIEKLKITSSQDAVNILRKLFDEDTINAYEQAYILYLNKNNKVIGYYHHSSGGIDGTVMDVQMISGMALKSLAKGVIIAHNHPSENTQPSDADKKITNQLKDALKLFNIYLMDSIILTDDSFFSFSDDGLL